MFSWGSRRKFLYIASSAFLFLFVLIAIFIVIFYRRPSCSDGVQNGDEQGIDCGGSCSTICSSAAQPVKIDWARAFKVKDKYYSVAAYIDNPNNYEATDVPYQFRVYDANNILIAEPSGKTFIPAGQSVGILEGGLYFGDRIPSRVTFEWLGNPVWKKTNINKDLITIADITRSVDNGGLPTISAAVINQGLQPVRNIFGFVVAYNIQGDAVAASETVVNKVDGGGQGNMVFSWPAPWSDTVTRVEILHWVLPNSNQN